MDAAMPGRETLRQIGHDLDCWLTKDGDGRCTVDRVIFTDPTLFALEMKHIFEANWVFLGHESQVARPNDFLATHMGRQPVLLTRDRTGAIKCFINACTHRGTRLCRERKGNRKHFTCPFHGWVFGSNGELLDVTDEYRGGYPASFQRKDMGLAAVPKVESYRGFIFGSLSADVPRLEDYLGGATAFIDLLVDQSPTGQMEVLKGATRYTYSGNWKLQTENGLDGYHVATVHANYFMTVTRRLKGEFANPTRPLDVGQWNQVDGGSFSFDNGHAVLWADYANYQDRPNYERIEEIRLSRGELAAKWMNGRIRNLLIAPNVFLMDQASTQIRIVRPIAVNETEIMTYCIAPVGESAAARALRIRQYEDFFNASGMATPDDLTEFDNCQIGYAQGSGRMNEMSRGATRAVEGVARAGAGLDFKARRSGVSLTDEVLYMPMHDDWIERMKTAVARELGALEAAE